MCACQIFPKPPPWVIGARTFLSARAQDRVLREQYLTKVERKCKVGDATGGRRDRWETRQVGDAKGVTHTSPGQRPGFISPKTHQR